ncbi:hypothetical protein Pcinc_003189 [Petrolisthes cinctipes]|uniref:Uncharacterized protein n=1 Tax=Petrolisthes cinctipes TaxID=88211 RepID=A0AAE1GHU1_PETCI|nr:hypothetical protein Pcinc_003189 [Petrolisthes cinctipes]
MARQNSPDFQQLLDGYITDDLSDLGIDEDWPTTDKEDESSERVKTMNRNIFYGHSQAHHPGSSEENEDDPEGNEDDSEHSHDELSDSSYNTESSSDSDSEEEEASNTNTTATESDDNEGDVAVSVGVWSGVTTSVRAFIFTGKEELCIRPQMDTPGTVKCIVARVTPTLG